MATRLVRSSLPPQAMGVMWSTWVAGAPHVWQVRRSRRSTWERVLLHAHPLPVRVACLPPPQAGRWWLAHLPSVVTGSPQRRCPHVLGARGMTGGLLLVISVDAGRVNAAPEEHGSSPTISATHSPAAVDAAAGHAQRPHQSLRWQTWHGPNNPTLYPQGG